MIHSTTAVEGPWYLGGNIATGCPGGLDVARQLLPTVWIAAHDKFVNPGKNIWTTEYDIMDVQTQFWEELLEQREKRKPQILRLEAGDTVRVDGIGASMVVEETTQNAKKKEEEEEEVTAAGKASGMSEEELESLSCAPETKAHDPVCAPL
jgi:hypothetical protein